MISKKLRKQLTNKSFEINIFETTIFLIDKEDTFKKLCDDIDYTYDGIDDSSGLCLSTVKDGTKDIFIGIFAKRDDVIVHECVHASLYILNNIQENPSYDSELQPYLVQTIYRECKRLLSA